MLGIISDLLQFITTKNTNKIHSENDQIWTKKKINVFETL